MNHIQSPRTCDASIEEAIKAKGLTAPRVTPEDVENSIVSCYFFTAREGVIGEEHINKRPTASYEAALGLLTFCVLVLRNGFTVTGESACASPENFDADIGKKIARANAVNKIWPLLGYVLKNELYKDSNG
jgi:hypothetical protein